MVLRDLEIRSNVFATSRHPCPKASTGVLADSVTVLYTYIQNLGTNHDKIESLIGNLANSSEPEKIVNVC
jgi:hypothetical protein